jgi:bifunctional non-homologous end joining protein LigD
MPLTYSSSTAWICARYRSRRGVLGLSRLLHHVKHGLHLSDHVEAEGPIVFRHACALGVEGIVSKRKGSPYRSGRTPDWIKCKNPESAAVKREAEEDWGR